MTCERAQTHLQEQLEGTLDAGIDRDLRAHLAACAECRGLAADLTAIAAATRRIAPIDPPERVWLQLAARWRAENPSAVSAPLPFTPRRRSFVHVLAAAAVLSVAVGGGWIAWRATTVADPAAGTAVLLPKPDPARTESNAADAALVESAQKDIEAAEQLYTRAIAGLEQVAAAERDALEPQVASMLDRNLAVIDDAIAESRAAVQSEPESVVARESLFDALRKKVNLLQDTIALVGNISSGNAAGATRLAGT